VSTKVYEAYKMVNAKDLWPFVRDVQQKAELAAKTILKKVLVGLASNIDTSSDEYQKYKTSSYVEKDEELARLGFADMKMIKGYLGQLGSAENNPFDFSASLVFREYKKEIYIIPHRGMPFGVKRKDSMWGDVFSFLRRDPRVVDFAYWNNTDRPRNISAREWEARGRVWDALDANGWRANLVYEVTAPGGLYLLNPYSEVVREVSLRKKREAAKIKRPPT
jgi:hypothetical protein